MMHREDHEDGVKSAMDAGVIKGVLDCSLTDFSFERAAQLIAAGSSGSNPDAPAGLGRLLESWTATNSIKDLSLGVCLPREVLAVIGGLLGGVARVPPSHVLRSSGLAAKNNAVYLTGAPAEEPCQDSSSKPHSRDACFVSIPLTPGGHHGGRPLTSSCCSSYPAALTFEFASQPSSSCLNTISDLAVAAEHAMLPVWDFLLTSLGMFSNTPMTCSCGHRDPAGPHLQLGSEAPSCSKLTPSMSCKSRGTSSPSKDVPPKPQAGLSLAASENPGSDVNLHTALDATGERHAKVGDLAHKGGSSLGEALRMTGKTGPGAEQAHAPTTKDPAVMEPPSRIPQPQKAAQHPILLTFKDHALEGQFRLAFNRNRTQVDAVALVVLLALWLAGGFSRGFSVAPFFIPVSIVLLAAILLPFCKAAWYLKHRQWVVISVVALQRLFLSMHFLINSQGEGKPMERLVEMYVFKELFINVVEGFGLRVILQHNVAILTIKAVMSILNIAAGILFGCCGLSPVPCMLWFTAMSILLGFAIPTYIGRRWEQEGRVAFADRILTKTEYRKKE